jgi:hypothetical protein
MINLHKIWDYIKSPKGQRNLLIILLVLVIVFWRGCGSVDSIDVMEYEQNIAALKDSLRVYKDKNGDLIYEKASLIASAKELKHLNEELAKEIKYLKDNPVVVIKWKTKIVHDTVYIYVEPEDSYWNSDSTIKTVPFNWNYDTIFIANNYRKIGGKYLVHVDTASLDITSDSFMISTDEIGMSFTTGLTENEDDFLEIFIKSSYPGFVPTDVDGALIDPRESKVIKKFFPPKRWGLGLYAGYGVYMDPWKGNVGHGFSAGASITFSLVQWKGKK